MFWQELRGENLKKLIESTKEKLEDVENRPYYTVAALNEKYKNVIINFRSGRKTL